MYPTNATHILQVHLDFVPLCHGLLLLTNGLLPLHELGGTLQLALANLLDVYSVGSLEASS